MLFFHPEIPLQEFELHIFIITGIEDILSYCKMTYARLFITTLKWWLRR